MTTNYQKTTAEVLDYVVDWSAWLVADTIATSTWAVDSGITKVSNSNTTTTATVFLSLGTVTQNYLITNTITTAGGRTAERSFYVAIVANEFV